MEAYSYYNQSQYAVWIKNTLHLLLIVANIKIRKPMNDITFHRKFF